MKQLFPTPALQRGSTYRPSDHTNIQDTWKKHGWQPKKRTRKQHCGANTTFPGPASGVHSDTL